MPVTTTQNYMQDMSAPKAFTPETQEVMNRMMGVKSKWQIYSEFFGVSESDMHNHTVLEELGVNYCEALKNLGVTQEEFNVFTNNYAGKTGTTAKSTSTTESERNTTVPTRGRRAKKDTE